MDWNKKLEQFDAIIKMVEGIERKGKTMPYTSVNGHMYSQLNKSGEIGIRLSKQEQKLFKEKYEATHFESYGAVMKDYVKIPEELHSDYELMASLFVQSYQYTLSLPPK